MNNHHQMDWERVRRLLIVLPSWVGDAVMATPLLGALRRDERLRSAHIAGYMRPGLDELLDGCPSTLSGSGPKSELLNERIVGRPAGLTGPWSEGRRLARHGCDAAILLPNSWRLAATVRLARIPVRIGYNRDARGWLLTHNPPCPTSGGWKEPISAVDYYLALGRALGVETADRRMMLRASVAQAEAAEALLRRAGLDKGAPFAVLNPGASKAEKRWPAGRFAALADHLAQSHGLRVLISGSPSERPLVGEILAAARSGPIDLAAQDVTLGSLKAILPRATLVVTNDTGTRHIAAAAAIACAAERPHASMPAIVTLFGPTDPRWAAIDYPLERQIIAPDQRIASLTLEQVVQTCDDMLRSRA